MAVNNGATSTYMFFIERGQRRPMQKNWSITVIAFVYIPLDNSQYLWAPLILFTSLIDIGNCKMPRFIIPRQVT